MTNHRCDFCGRFFSSPLPDAYGCPEHIAEGNAKLREAIARSNARHASRTQAAKAGEALSVDNGNAVNERKI